MTEPMNEPSSSHASSAVRAKRMGVVRDDGIRPRTRHINWSANIRFGAHPICCTDGMRWRASTSEAVHALPVCRNCMTLVENTKADLDADEGIARPVYSGRRDNA